MQALVSAASSAARVEARDPHAVRGSEGWVLALVALDAQQGEPSEAAMEPVLQTIKRLRSSSVPIIAYGEGSQDWPLATRCQILLAGAPTLLDSASTDFRRRLAAELATRVGTATSEEAADRRLGEAVRELGIVGRSPALVSALFAVERSARLSDMPVLLVGESGTGKELLARAVHVLDQRRRPHPFIAVNCAALTKTLAEAELFGHRKGTYSGADRDRPGLIRTANGGVLFLDEIGELDLDLQAKLLRVIQERSVLTLGDTQETPVDVRIVAATHRDLKAMVREGRFRADLLNRLWVYPVEVPPLRQRREDLGELVTFLLQKHLGAEAPLPPVAPEFMEALRLARLEGNVRQLESIVQRALAITDGQRPLGLAELPPELWAELAEHQGPTPPPARSPVAAPADLNLSRALTRHERMLVQSALETSDGNQTRAANLLGITVRSMYTKLRKHRLERRASAACPS